MLEKDLATIIRATRFLESESVPTSPASGSNGGVRANTPGPRVPVTEWFYYLIDKVEPVLSGWAMNLATNIQEQTPRQSGTSWWAVWLLEHVEQLRRLERADECEAELHGLAMELASVVDPPEPQRVPQFMTLQQLADQAGTTPAAMHKRLQRMHPRPEPYKIGGTWYYRTNTPPPP